MYPLILAAVFALMTVMMMPGRMMPFSELAFSNPDAAAEMGRAEVYAHNMAIFAEAVTAVWRDDPGRIPVAPDTIMPVDLAQKAEGYLPVNYRPVLPWRASLLRDGDRPEVLVVFLEREALGPRITNAALAHGLRLTAGNQTPVGIVYAGRLGMRDITRDHIARKYRLVGDFPPDLLPDGAVAIIVCIGTKYCADA